MKHMAPGAQHSVADNREGFRRARVWQAIHSFLTGITSSRKAVTIRIPIVALVVSEHDRTLLTGVSNLVPLEIHFVESWEEAYTVANDLTAPVILLDRDWPDTQWKVIVQTLAASAHHACVVLMSGVADDYLWQELVRRGGYELLPKPLRSGDVIRVMKLALSYWASVANTPAPARTSRK
jgi:FixJ family two-component response regulator